MCRSFSEGGRRCECQLGERRRAYQRGLYAKRKAQGDFKRTRRASTPTPPPPATPFDWRSVDPKELTDEQIDTAVAQLREERVTLVADVSESWSTLTSFEHDFEDISDPRFLPESIAYGSDADRSRYVAAVGAVGSNVEEAAFLRAASRVREDVPLTEEEKAELHRSDFQSTLESVKKEAEQPYIAEFLDAGVDVDNLLKSNLYKLPERGRGGYTEAPDPDPEQLDRFLEIVDPDGSAWEAYCAHYPPSEAPGPQEHRRRFLRNMNHLPQAAAAGGALRSLSFAKWSADRKVADVDRDRRRREGYQRKLALEDELSSTVAMGEGWTPDVFFYGSAGKNKATKEGYAELLSDATSHYPRAMLEPLGGNASAIRLASNPRSTARGGQFRAQATRKDKFHGHRGVVPVYHTYGPGGVILVPMARANQDTGHSTRSREEAKKLVDKHNADLEYTGERQARLPRSGDDPVGRLEIIDDEESGTYRIQTVKPERFTYSQPLPEIEADSGSVMVHEVGHLVERNNPQVALACKQFLDQRRRRSGAVKHRMGAAKYESVQDEFVDDYAGRDYEDSVHTEVFTTGMEGMFGWGENPSYYRNYLTPPAGGKHDDAEHRRLVLGLLASS